MNRIQYFVNKLTIKATNKIYLSSCFLIPIYQPSLGAIGSFVNMVELLKGEMPHISSVEVETTVFIKGIKQHVFIIWIPKEKLSNILNIEVNIRYEYF